MENSLGYSDRESGSDFLEKVGKHITEIRRIGNNRENLTVKLTKPWVIKLAKISLATSQVIVCIENEQMVLRMPVKPDEDHIKLGLNSRTEINISVIIAEKDDQIQGFETRLSTHAPRLNDKDIMKRRNKWKRKARKALSKNFGEESLIELLADIESDLNKWYNVDNL